MEDLIGPFNSKGVGLLVYHHKEKTAIAMVPPLEFKFKSKRETIGSSTRRPPTELVVTAHFMCMVDRPAPKGPRFAFDDVRAEYSEENKHAYKIAVADAMRRLGPEVEVPARLLSFLSIL